MSRYSFTLLRDAALLQELDQTAIRRREASAMPPAQNAEVDEPRAHRPGAYPRLAG